MVVEKQGVVRPETSELEIADSYVHSPALALGVSVRRLQVFMADGLVSSNLNSNGFSM